MNRREVTEFLDSFFADLKNAPAGSPGAGIGPFLDLVFSLKKELPFRIPILRDLAAFSRAAFSRAAISQAAISRAAADREDGLLRQRINRRYLRLCRIQEELGRLDLKKTAAQAKTSLEDYVFSQIDFSRYREMGEKEFEALFPGGLTDFSESFFIKNFGMGRPEIRLLIEGSYSKNGAVYSLRRENQGREFHVLSVMRTLETSLETLSLFTAGETGEELKNLLDYVNGHTSAGNGRGTELIFPLLVRSLDNKHINHEDGTATKLFVSPNGDLSGTFFPGGKPWTLLLIAGNRNANPY